MDDICCTPTSPEGQKATNNSIPSTTPKGNPDFQPVAGHCGQGGNVK